MRMTSAQPFMSLGSNRADGDENETVLKPWNLWKFTIKTGFFLILMFNDLWIQPHFHLRRLADHEIMPQKVLGVAGNVSVRPGEVWENVAQVWEILGNDTVDGRNPAPVGRWFYPMIIPRFTVFHSHQNVTNWCRISSIHRRILGLLCSEIMGWW